MEVRMGDLHVGGEKTRGEGSPAGKRLLEAT